MWVKTHSLSSLTTHYRNMTRSDEPVRGSGAAQEPEAFQVVDTDVVSDQVCHVCLIMDHSGSTRRNGRIDAINQSLKDLSDFLKTDEVTADTVVVSIVRCGGDVEVVREPTPGVHFSPPEFEPKGKTPMCEAIGRGLDLIEKKMLDFKQKGLQTYPSFPVIVTDGAFTDKGNGTPPGIDEVSDRIERLATAGAANPLPFGTRDADFDTLNRLTAGCEYNAFKMTEANYCDVMDFVAQSVRIRSVPDEPNRLPDPVDSGLRMA